MNQLNNINYMSSPYSMPTLDNYILQYAESFSRTQDIGKIIQKWTPYIDNRFSDINLSKDIKSNLAIYLDVCNSYYQNMSLTTNRSYNKEADIVYEEIRNRINNIKRKRSGVIKKVFNYETGFMEYELEDGNFIKINEPVTSPKVDVDNGIFPDVFLKIVDKEKYRDNRIDEIL